MLTDTIQTSCDAASQIVGIAELDLTTSLHTANPAAGTSYRYIYSRDGEVVRTHMAPGDLTQPGWSQASGTLSTAGTFYTAASLSGEKRKEFPIRMCPTTFTNRLDSNSAMRN